MEDMSGRIDQFKKDTDIFLDEITKNYQNARRTLMERQVKLSEQSNSLGIREAQCNELMQECRGQKAAIENRNIEIELLKTDLKKQMDSAKAREEAAINEKNLYIQKDAQMEKRLALAIQKEQDANEKERLLLDKESSLMALKKELAILQAQLKEKQA